LLAHGRWFSPGIAASSTTKTGRHDIAEILLKVALNTKNQSINLYSKLKHVLYSIKMKNKQYHTVRTIPKSNRTIVETEI
jgi:hypothetical protein